ncbi:helix-turn-helix domain-containing protein [Streptomyces finlayi]|uniref:Helix-turn-helix domain-containing protein n=1 Tax=Streptomyces finlayi TaxID=67296 RepID=A0A7G7BJS5_9ACTN|nr:helix-turn-helix domain-containing protein [Streptomyces finlayi]QNE75590.1 helix-turn-helix domain-containing protein [Streptomyces finlayi]
MDTPQVIAPPCAQPGSPGTQTDVTPTSGVLHVNVRHISGFTVIGNHLAQHRGLSLTAIGLAVHIQSLPAGAKVSIKVLTARFPESEARIAAALRELEATGYLHRSRVRLPDGRMVTRTVSYNQPGAIALAPQPLPRPRPRRSEPPAPLTVPPPAPPRDAAAPTTAPEPLPPAAPVYLPAPTAPRKQPPPLPHPHAPTEELHRAATALLADLRRSSPQLTLPETEIETLAPGVAAWLERDAHPDTIRHALTSDLPTPVKHPAKFVRSRITTLLPPPLPGTADLTPPRRKVIVIPLQNCDTCDRAFRATAPGHCRGCRVDAHQDPHTAAA